MSETKQSNRQVLANVWTPKEDGKPYTIRVVQDASLKEGDYLNLELNEFQLNKIDFLEKDGKLSTEVASEIRQKIKDRPDYIHSQIVLYRKG